MNEECLEILKELEEDIETIYEGTNPKIQRLPGVTVYVIAQRMRKNLKKFNTLTLMNSKFLDGLL